MANTRHQPKIALVCDWLTNIGGAERVLKSIHDLYPDAPIYTSQYDPKKISWFKDATVKTGWLQIFPSSLRRILSPLRQLYFSHLDLSDYDIIISVTGAEAKSIKKGNAKHFCYCHVPTQYYWHMYDKYLENPGFGILNPIIRFFFRLLIKPLRKADYRSAQKPDQFITISRYSATQIKKYYNRESFIIAPPVAVEKFQPIAKKRQASPKEYFINFSRQANWKRLDLIIQACLNTNQKLILIGDGPEHKFLEKLAKNSSLITFYPSLSQEELKQYLISAKAFIFPSLEPFGIAPLEAISAGCPVIAFNQGGAKDYINSQNGVFFHSQSPKSLEKALKSFNHQKFSPLKVQKTAIIFSEQNFQAKIKTLIKNETKV